MAKAARAINRAEQTHQNRQGAHCLETIAVRCQAAHRMKCHRIAFDAFVLYAPDIGPSNRQLNALVTGGDAQFVSQTANRCSRNPRDVLRPFRCAVSNSLLQQLKGWLRFRAIGHLKFTKQRGIGVWRMVCNGLARMAIPPEEIMWAQRIANVPFWIAQHHAKLIALLILADQLPRIGVARHKLTVIQPQADQLTNQSHEQSAVRARLDGNPFIGNRRIAAANRIDRNEAPAAALVLRQRGFHRVAVMVFSSADHHKQLGSLQIWPAKLPKASANGVDHARSHVDGAKAAVRGVIGRSELPCKQSR